MGTINNPKSISKGKVVKFDKTSADNYFSFTIDSPGNVVLASSYSKGEDSDYNFYDDQFNYIGRYFGDGSTTKELTKSGTYYIQVLRAEGLLFSPQTVGNDRDIDSDVDENGVSEALVLSAGYSIIYVDAGMFIEPTGTISGVVFLDKNKNGYRDANDTFLEDVVVFLFNEKKKFVKSIKTNALGQYTLKYIDPGYYYCMLPQFADKGFVLFTGSNMDMDSEFTNEFGQGTSRLFKIEAGVSIKHFDFGYMEIAGLDNPVIEDEIRPGTVEISIFPNPSLYYSHVQISESLIPAHLILRSVSGEIIRKEWIHNNRYILDTSDLKDGCYTVTIQSGKKRWSRSLVKTAN